MRRNPDIYPLLPSATEGQAASSAQRADGRAREGQAGVDAGRAARNEDLTRLWPSLDGLAFQAHLVALNAVVEAALAGEHGKGFSTVATEMLQLARRTTAVAEEIRDLLQEKQPPA